MENLIISIVCWVLGKPGITTLSLACSAMFIWGAVSFYRQGMMLQMVEFAIFAGLMAVVPWTAFSKSRSEILVVVTGWVLFGMASGPFFYKAITGKVTAHPSFWFPLVFGAGCLMAATVIVYKEIHQP